MSDARGHRTGGAGAAVDAARYRGLSLWHDTCGDDLEPRPRLDRDTEVDVAIVGGGFTGLWTARSLADADPTLRIMVIEAETCGFGASGRNGGWCSALLPTEVDGMHPAMVATVDEVGRAAAEDGIDCDYAKGGTLSLVTNPAHERRLRAHAEQWLDADAARARIDATGLLGAAFTPDCAAIHPAKLVRGLAAVVERRGVRIVERTAAIELSPGVVRTDAGVVRAEHVLRCTEGYTPTLAGERRTMVPLYSLMIATEPLPDEVWDRIGLRRRETFTDGRHLIIYGQRTTDGRIAFGGRGAPYHFGSAIRPSFDRDDAVFAELETVLRRLLPQVRDAAITHRWGGALGVPRDWQASVGFDRANGMGWAGGYVGDGVATTNLAGRTLADLVLGRDTELARLPWVDHRSRRWEPEPLRWLGIRGGQAIAASADRAEARTGREPRWRSRAMSWITGG
jgi:glycine/D-amino acid oxidase-like deaminating enzyme